MRVRRRSTLRAAALVLAAGACASAAAVTCTVSASGVAFGVYGPASGLADDTTGTVTLTCDLLTLLTSYQISLSTGAAGSFAPRKLFSGANALAYQLYSDATRSTVWGDGSGGTATVSGFIAISVGPVAVPHTVYARVPGGQTATKPGSYADTILVTVTY